VPAMPVRRSPSASPRRRAPLRPAIPSPAHPGTIVKVSVGEGQEVAEGDVVVFMEAMRIEQPCGHRSLHVAVGYHADLSRLSV
jgi:acetyl-CoA/propionyl-CoA carboxylase biotin carboxyl carrier protein